MQGSSQHSRLILGILLVLGLHWSMSIRCRLQIDSGRKKIHCGKASWQRLESVATAAFSCDDGVEIQRAEMCDGRPHCPDASDETLKLCQRVVCPPDRSLRCSYGACVPREARCNGGQDCVDASDELACESARECATVQFRCLESSECLSLELLCDGVEDCADKSDEALGMCRSSVCPVDKFRCSYGGCVHEEVVCDGLADCADGSDEAAELCAAANCRNEDESCRQYACKQDEFSCENGRQCLPLARLCDGRYHCRDGSDETRERCAARTCDSAEFRCAYGACIDRGGRCDGQQDCVDASDEDETKAGCQRNESGRCRLPGAHPGLLYRSLGSDECERCARPGHTVPEGARLEYACVAANASRHGAGVQMAECRAGVWLPRAPACPPDGGMVKCWALRSEGADRRCEARWGPAAGWISCAEPVPVGTRATLQCREHHRRSSGSSRLTCLRDGTWSQAALRCEPVCGLRLSQAQPSTTLIVNGWEVMDEEPLPWHATLFSHEHGRWQFFCGGTLISPRFVLTAAHCVWESDAATVLVVLAGSSSNFSELGRAAQVLTLRSIETQSSYQDHEGNYNSDLALLVLSRSARLGPRVMPACLDWANEYDISERDGQVGLISGMGVTENGNYSNRLRVVTAQVVSTERCRQNEAPEFRKYLAYTSFCAGWANGTGVCNGDSGGGFMLQRPDSDIWEIYGIVSLSPRRRDVAGPDLCDLNYYTVFTKISAYLVWLRKIIEANSLADDESADVDVLPNHDSLLLD